MKMQHPKTLIGHAIALALGLGSGTTQAAESRTGIIEARQESQIWTTYALSPYLRATDINVAVHGGKATLTGTVDEDVNKDLAKQIALGVDGIREVDNQIVIDADYVRPGKAPRRSYGDMIDDAGITAAVKSKLSWNARTNGLGTEVTTMWSRVTLIGAVPSPAVKDLAGNLALNTRGVQSVDNQLHVDRTPGRAMAAAGEASDDLADAWITAKVKSTFMYSSNVDGADISVSTSKGVVTLVGELATGAERALAIELAKNVRGVKQVQSSALSVTST